MTLGCSDDYSRKIILSIKMYYSEKLLLFSGLDEMIAEVIESAVFSGVRVLGV